MNEQKLVYEPDGGFVVDLQSLPGLAIYSYDDIPTTTTGPEVGCDLPTSGWVVEVNAPEISLPLNVTLVKEEEDKPEEGEVTMFEERPHQGEEAVVDKVEFEYDEAKPQIRKRNGFILEKINRHMKIYRCRECPKYYYDRSSFSHHFNIHSESAFVCDFCNERFVRKYSLKTHLYNVHLAIKPYKCQKCSESVSRKFDLIRHMKTAHGISNISCEFCKKKFDSLLLLNMHNCGQYKPYACELCHKSFKAKKTLSSHIVQMHFNKRRRHHACDKCDRSYSTAASLYTHQRTHTDRAFTCNFCKRSFMAKQTLFEHIIGLHLGVKPYSCRFCLKRFSQKTSRTVHERKHTGRNMFKCKICLEEFQCKSRLKDHYMKHMDVKPFQCSHCDFLTSNEYNLDKHLKRAHGNVDETAFSCDKCDAKTATKDQIACHMMIHTGIPPFQCETCNKTFNKKRSLDGHVRRHQPQTLYQCPICFKTCRDKKYHMRIHNDEKPFVCHICNKSFRSKHHSELHHRVHTGEKPYQCEICSKTFSFSSNLNAHLRVHSGEKMYVCLLCNKAFPYQSGLRRHTLAEVCMKKDKVEIQVPTLIRPKTLSNPHYNQVDPNRTIYSCSRCSKEFYHKSSFNRHNKVCPLRYDINALQNGQSINNFKCDTCGRCYKNRSSLSMHRRMHSLKFITCGICSKPFIRKSHYREHMLSKHSVVKPYTCRYCKCSFHLKHIIQRHIRKTHGDDADPNNFDTFTDAYAYNLTTEIISNYLDDGSSKPFKCKICSRSYKSKANCDKHEATHNTASQLCCNFCGKVFRQKAQLEEHERYEHKKVQEAQTILVISEPEKRIKCIYCELLFAKKEDCDRHMESHWSISTGGGAVYATNSTIQNISESIHADIHAPVLQNATIHVTSSPLESSPLQTVDIQNAVAISSVPVSAHMESTLPTSILHATSHLQPIHVSNSGNIYTYNTFQPTKLPSYTLQRAYSNWDDPADLVTYEAIPLEEPDNVSLDNEPTDIIYVLDNNEQLEKVEVKQEKEAKAKPYKCDECNKSYTTEKNLLSHKAIHSGEAIDCVFCNKSFPAKLHKSHMKNVHTVMKMLKCPVCGEFFLKKRFLDEHIKIHEIPEETEVEAERLLKVIGPDGIMTLPVVKKKKKKSAKNKLEIDKPYKCYDCGKSYFTRTSLSTHRRIHTGKALSCVFCSKQFIKKHQLKDHLTAVHIKVKSHPCEMCPETFSRLISLQKHIRLVHTPKPTLPPGANPAKPFRCSECDKGFGSKNYLNEHMKLHTGQGIACVYCKKIFTKEKAVREHIMAIHTNVKPYKCEFCDKAFTQKSNFNMHRRKHTGEKLRKCQFCAKTFTSRAPLQRHIRSHTGQKPFPCTLCTKTFSDSSNLKKHMGVHSGDKRYHCLDCNVGFSTKKSYNNHMGFHAGRTNPNLFTCKECEVTFASSTEYDAHLKLHTVSKRTFWCAMCSRGFMGKQSLVSHIYTHLGLNSIICAVCNKSFRTKSQVRMHMKVHSQKFPKKL